MDYSTQGFPAHHQLLELAQTHIHWVGDAIQPSHPLSPPSPALNLPQHQGLFHELALWIRWPKYWSFSISPSNEYSRLITIIAVTSVEVWNWILGVLILHMGNLRLWESWVAHGTGVFRTGILAASWGLRWAGGLCHYPRISLSDST